MLEDITLHHTKMSHKNERVFVLQFPVGEFDMVRANQEKETCEIYEIKHSKEISPFQTRHLIDEEKLKSTAFLYGDIVSKNVLYQGEAGEVDEITYQNVSDYLLSL